MPSRMTLQIMKAKYKGAAKGYDLLKKKADAIKNFLHKILRKILVVKERVGKLTQVASVLHTKASWATGGFNNQVIESTKAEAAFKVTALEDNVAGVKIPVFSRAGEDIEVVQLVGLSRGGQQVTHCRKAYYAVAKDLIELASLKTQLLVLDEAFKVTNRRVNALDYVVMPMIMNTIKYINDELDELEREEFARLKKVKDNMTKRQAIQQAQNKKALRQVGRTKSSTKSAIGGGSKQDIMALADDLL